jgi:DNA topoisomerase-1
VRHGSVFASLPKDKPIEDVQLDEALIWLAEKAAKGPVKKSRGRTAGRKKAATEKTTTAALKPAKKKAATKKKAAKKKAAKKKAPAEATE